MSEEEARSDRGVGCGMDWGRHSVKREAQSPVAGVRVRRVEAWARVMAREMRRLGEIMCKCW